jgi:hypothetical protein
MWCQVGDNGRGVVAAAVMACVAVPGAGAVPAVAGEVPAVGLWGTAIEVSGLGALNSGGHAGVLSVSCGSGGNCAAGGIYTDSSGHLQGFVVSGQDGR